MSILQKITTGKRGRAQKVVIYGPEGFGKSTLAGQFPDALFLDVEDSTSQLDVRRLSREELPTLKAIEAALDEIVKAQACHTLVIDTMDWLEQLVLDAMIADAGSPKIQGIEDFGYGKGYTILKERVTLLLAQFDRAIQAGISVVLLAHSKVVKFEPPDGAGPYDRYELKLSKHVAPLIKEWADALLFGNWRTQVREKDRNEAGAQFKGVGGKDRVLYCNRCASWDAKNRHGLGDTEKWEIGVLQKAFQAVNAPWGNDGATPEVKPVATAPAEEPDEIPGLPAAEKPADEELARICEPHAVAIDAYLVTNKRIKPGQSYQDVDAAFATRIKKNPAGFLKVAVVEAKEAA